MKIIKINDVLYDVVEDDPKNVIGCVDCDLFDECPESQSCKCQCVLLVDSDHHFERHGKAEKSK